MESKKLSEFNDEESFYRYVFKMVLDSNAFINIEFFGVVGSIGRREKSIYEDKINDIDFILVGELSSLEAKKKLELLLCGMTNTKYTDIFVINRIFIKKNTVEQYLYDFIFGHITIFSSESFTQKLNEWREKKLRISSFSILNLFITRGYGYLLCTSAIEDTYYHRYQMRKVISAYIDGVMIANEIYSVATLSEKINTCKNFIDMESAIFYVNNYEDCEFEKLKEYMAYCYTLLLNMVMKNCKRDVAKIILKCFVVPNGARVRYAIEFIKLVWRLKLK